MVNLTAENIGEIVSLSHEFAIGLTEHFDILHRVSKGDLNARVSGSSQVELLESLKKITNEMIDNISRDITERKQAEEKLRNIIEHSNELFYTHDTNHKLIYISPQSMQILGYSPDEIVIEWTKLTTENPINRTGFEITEKALKTGEKQEPYLLEFNKKDGSKVLLEIDESPLKDDMGKVIGMVGAARDITERKKLEEQFLQAQKMEAIGRLTGGIAHDFNNILQAIMSIGGLLQIKIKEGDPLKEYINDLFAVAERAASLTKSLLAFSRKQIISLMPINLNDIIKNAEKILSRVMGEDIELKTNLSDKDLVIMADSGQIEQVLMNLATNSRDAMPEGGQLIIETDTMEMDDEYIKTHGYGKAGKYALMTVTDTGIGMDEETKKKLFEPFFTTKEVGKGTGLGLSTVYGIVKQHNGYINVYSEVGGGTAFKIYLPIIKPDILEKTEFAKEGMVYTGGTETILIAEDDEPVRKLTKETLERAGYKVIDAVDGDDAMEKFMEHKDEIQLLLLDVIMPKRNGREVYDEIRKIRPEVRVIFVSGYPADFIATKGIIEEGLNFIAKPLPPNQLLKKIREMLNRPI
jgi:PAS domain S-box-containing protein